MALQRRPLDTKTVYAATPLSKLEIYEQDGRIVTGPIGSGTFTNPATITNSNIIQGNASEVGGFNQYIKTIKILSVNKDANFIVRIKSGAGFLGTVPSTADREFYAPVKAGVVFSINIDQLIVWGASIYLFVENFADTTGNANVKFYSDSIKIFHCTNPFAKYSVLGVGDSIMKGIGASYVSTQPYLAHFALTYKWYLDMGYDIKGINKGVPGATIEDIAALIRTSDYNVSSPVSIIKFSIGTNVSPSDASFSASLTEILDYFQKRWPDAIKLIEAPVNRLDIKEQNLVNYRAIMSAAVVARADPKMFYLDLSAAFNASDPQYGIIMGDYNTGVGGNVHPNDAGHKKINDLEKAFCIANNIYPS